MSAGKGSVRTRLTTVKGRAGQKGEWKQRWAVRLNGRRNAGPSLPFRRRLVDASSSIHEAGCWPSRGAAVSSSSYAFPFANWVWIGRGEGGKEDTDSRSPLPT